jgi:hypothetical protein
VALCEWLCRPRVRLTVTGLALLLVGGLFITSSVWTLPLVIAGGLMVLIAWVGYRLEGRLAVEWGQTGTQLEFRAQIRAAEGMHTAPAETTPRLVSTADPEPEDAVVVEGEAHTVEIEVTALKALIAAAETAEAVTAEVETAEVETVEVETAQAEASAQAARVLRVAHGGGRSSQAGG